VYRSIVPNTKPSSSRKGHLFPQGFISTFPLDPLSLQLPLSGTSLSKADHKIAQKCTAFHHLLISPLPLEQFQPSVTQNARHHLFTTLGLFSNFVFGVQKLNDTIDSSTCVAPTEYQSCYDLAVETTSACVNATETADGLQGCGCADYTAKINCVASKCWNRVRFLLLF
jgi:hypothetical protein